MLYYKTTIHLSVCESGKYPPLFTATEVNNCFFFFISGVNPSFKNSSFVIKVHEGIFIKALCDPAFGNYMSSSIFAWMKMYFL